MESSTNPPRSSAPKKHGPKFPSPPGTKKAPQAPHPKGTVSVIPNQSSAAQKPQFVPRLITPGPIAFIQYPREEDSEDQDIKLTNEARELLTKLNKPLKIIGIIGSYRGGKSFILNQLLGVKKGFDLGHEVEGKTRDIWLWGVDRGDHIVLAVDTEGLYDISNRDEALDAKIFTVSIMVSSFLIYNVMQKLDEHSILRLGLVTQIMNHLKTDNEEGLDFHQHLPPLLWLVRDFSLQFKEGTNPQTYLSQALSERAGRGASVARSNEIRKAITTFFPSLECTTLPTPVLNMEEDLCRIEEDESLLRPNFVSGVTSLIAKLHSETPWKEISLNGFTIKMDGPSYVKFIEMCIAALNGNETFDIPDSFSAICREKGEAGLAEAVKLYTAQMDQITLPIEAEELQATHLLHMDTAVQLVSEAAMGTLKEEYIQKILDAIEEFKGDQLAGGLYFKYATLNLNASKDLCTQLVENAKASVDLSKCTSMAQFNQAAETAYQSFKLVAVGPARLACEQDLVQSFNVMCNQLMNKLQISKLEQNVVNQQRQLEQTQKALEAQKAQGEKERQAFAAKQKQMEQTMNQIQAKRREEQQEWQAKMQRHQEAMEQKIKIMQADNQKNIQNALSNQRQQFMMEQQRQDALHRQRMSQINSNASNGWGIMMGQALGQSLGNMVNSIEHAVHPTHQQQFYY